jgi:hypothetical protein
MFGFSSFPVEITSFVTIPVWHRMCQTLSPKTINNRFSFYIFDSLVKSSVMPLYGIITGSNLQCSYLAVPKQNPHFYLMSRGGFKLPLPPGD